jgi:hypothetical protein
MSEITIIGWVSYQEAEAISSGGKPNLGGLGGWVKGHDFNEYLAHSVAPEFHAHYIALRNDIQNRNIRFGGDAHQTRPDGCPLWSDGSVATFTWRAWGDLLAATYNRPRDQRIDLFGVNHYHSYLCFYMDETCDR